MIPQSPVLRRFAVTHFLLEAQFWFPVWMLYLDARGFSLATMVLADGVFRSTMVLMEFPLGVLSDRIGRKRTYLGICVLAVITYVGIVLINGPVLLFGSWILWGIFWAMSSGASTAYCYELIAREGMQERSVAIFGFMRAVANTAMIASQLAAGALFDVDPALPFAANGIFALSAFALTYTLPDIDGSSTDQVGKVWDEPRRIFGLLHGNRPVLAALAVLAVAVVYYWSPRILMQPFMLDLGIEPVGISAIYFCYSLAGVLSGLVAGPLRKRVGLRSSVMLGFGSLWLGVLLVFLAPGRLALAFFPLLSFGYFLARIVLEVYIHRSLENRHRAAVFSAASFVGGAVMILTRPGLGMLADLESAHFAFGVWTLIGVALGVTIFAFVGRLARETT